MCAPTVCELHVVKALDRKWSVQSAGTPGGGADRVGKAFQEGGLQLRDKGLEPWASLGNEQANGVQQGGLHLPGQPVPNDPDHWTCTPTCTTLIWPAHELNASSSAIVKDCAGRKT